MASTFSLLLHQLPGLEVTHRVSARTIALKGDFRSTIWINTGVCTTAMKGKRNKSRMDTVWAFKADPLSYQPNMALEN
jgi:hypothetical protein